MPAVHPTALKVAERLRAAGLDVDVQELDAPTRTAEEAAPRPAASSARS